MLRSLHITNFTAFDQADFEFSPGLNILVGTNGTGKSHILKLGYALQVAYAAAPREIAGVYQPSPDATNVITVAAALTRIQEAFLTNGIQKLVRHPNTEVPRRTERASIKAIFGQSEQGILDFYFDDVVQDSFRFFTMPQTARVGAAMEKPVFIPAKELLSLMPNILGLSDKYADLFDSTYTGLARALVVPRLKNPPSYAQQVLLEVERLLRGQLEAENGRFYLVAPLGGERLDIQLVAEGYRKLGTLAYLLANGSLSQDNTLYWDEPEANLNPALLREVAQMLVLLAEQGIQIIVATHSLFLLKELHILANERAAKVRYFGLSALPGEPTQVTKRDDLEQLPDIVALDAELEQSDRFQAVLDQEDTQVEDNAH